MSRTFYLAAASANVETAKARIADLTALGWECGYDWPKNIDDRRPATDLGVDMSDVALAEIYAARRSCLVVALAPVSLGVAVEIGARLGFLGAVHVVGEWEHVPFSSHPSVRHHASWEFFLASLSAGAL